MSSGVKFMRLHSELNYFKFPWLQYYAHFLVYIQISFYNYGIKVGLFQTMAN